MAKLKLGTWSHSVYDFGEQDEILRHADRLAEGGFGLLIPCVKNPHGFADFFTEVADVNPKYPDWDPLRVLIDACQERRVKVHLWFCVFPEGRDAKLLREHPEYEAQIETQFPWACACRPEVREYLLALYKDVGKRYRPDGLHLDYIRTGGPCKCGYCKKEMTARGVDIAKVEHGGPESQKWVRWRADKITSFVRRMRTICNRGGLELSAAVFSGYPDCIEHQGQDWVAWAEQGLVDYLFPMTYTVSPRMLQMRTVAHVAQVGRRVPVWEGLCKQAGAIRLTTRGLAAQARLARECGAKGVVLFSYPAVTNADIKALKDCT